MPTRSASLANLASAQQLALQTAHAKIVHGLDQCNTFCAGGPVRRRANHRPQIVAVDELNCLTLNDAANLVERGPIEHEVVGAALDASQASRVAAVVHERMHIYSLR